MNKNFLLLSSLLLGLPDASTTWATTQSSNEANDEAKLMPMKEHIRRGITDCVQQLGLIYKELFQFQNIWATLGYDVLNWTTHNEKETYGVTEPNNPNIDCLTNTTLGSTHANQNSVAWGVKHNVRSSQFKDSFSGNADNAITKTNAAWSQYMNTKSKLEEYYNKLNMFIQQMETIQAFVQKHPDRVKVLSQPWLQQFAPVFGSITPPLDVNTYTMLYTVRDSNGKKLWDFLCNRQTVSNPQYPRFDKLNKWRWSQNAILIGATIEDWKKNIANVMLWQKATLDFSGTIKGLEIFNNLDNAIGLGIFFLVPEFVNYFKKLSTCIGIALNNITVNNKIVETHCTQFQRALKQCKDNAP